MPSTQSPALRAWPGRVGGLQGRDGSPKAGPAQALWTPREDRPWTWGSFGLLSPGLSRREVRLLPSPARELGHPITAGAVATSPEEGSPREAL